MTKRSAVPMPLTTNVLSLLLFVAVHSATCQQEDQTKVLEELATFINNGQGPEKPCDDFYKYVCGKQQSAYQQTTEKFLAFINKALNLSDENNRPFHSVSKALVEYSNSCAEFERPHPKGDGDSRLITVRNYIDSFPNETMRLFLRTLLHLSMVEIKGQSTYHNLPFYNYNSDFRAFILHLGLSTAGDQLDRGFANYFIENNGTYNFQPESPVLLFILKHFSNYFKISVQQEEVAKFAKKLFDIFRSHSDAGRLSRAIAQPISKLKNSAFRRALTSELISFKVITETQGDSFNALVNEDLINDLTDHFTVAPTVARMALLNLAVSSMPFIEDIIEGRKIDHYDCDVTKHRSFVYLNRQFTTHFYYNYAKLHHFPLTTTKERDEILPYFDNIRNMLRKKLMIAEWSQSHPSAAEATVDEFMSLGVRKGFPDYYDNNEKILRILETFEGYSPDEDFYSKEITLRKLNFRIFQSQTQLQAPVWLAIIFDIDYFDQSSYYKKNNLRLKYGSISPPAYHRHYPISYSYGYMGSLIGHGLLKWFQDESNDRVNISLRLTESTVEFSKSFECYRNFFDNKCVDFLAYNDETQSTQNDRYCAKNGYNLLRSASVIESVRASYAAMKCQLKDHLKDVPMPEKLPGITHEQLFFIGFGERWCGNRQEHDVYWREQQNIKNFGDGELPDVLRVHTLAMQMPEFSEAFQCKKGDKMAPEKLCDILPPVNATILSCNL